MSQTRIGPLLATTLLLASTCSNGPSASEAGPDADTTDGGLADVGDGDADATDGGVDAGGDADAFTPPAGSLLWVRSATLEAGGMLPTVTVATDGAPLVTGAFYKTAIFEPGLPEETTIDPGNGATNAFVARFGSEGSRRWIAHAGGTYITGGLGVARAPGGDALIAGLFLDATTFGAGEPAEISFRSRGLHDAAPFVARYGADGRLAWAKSSDGGAARAIVPLADGASIVVGTFGGTTTFGPGETGETVLTADDGDDTFLAWHEPDGALRRVAHAGGSGNVVGLGAAALDDGSHLVVGHFDGNATFGRGEASETTLTTVGGSDAFVARYASDGSFEWARHAGGVGFEAPTAVAALPDESFLVVGLFDGSTTFGRGEPGETELAAGTAGDVFVARYDASGDLAWVKQIEAAVEQEPGALATAVADTSYTVGLSVASSSFVVTGAFSGTMTLGEGEAEETTLTSAGERDIWVARIGLDGALLWARRAGGTGADSGSSIVAGADDSLFVTGLFDGSATFGPGEMGETTLASDGGGLFLMRLSL